MKPAEELRAAAAKLRELAAATVGGKWAAKYLEQHDCWWVNHETEDGDWITHGTVAELDSVGMAGNAAWVALMGPVTAPGFADVLEHHADCINWANSWDDGLTHGDTVKRLARSILGESQ